MKKKFNWIKNRMCFCNIDIENNVLLLKKGFM